MIRYNYPVRAFCNTTIRAGDPLSYVRVNSNCGMIEVKKYNGLDYYGISAYDVVEIDLTKTTPSFPKVPIGGVIEVIGTGTVNLSRELFKSWDVVEVNRHIKPTKKGWKAQVHRTKKTVGIIIAKDEEFVQVRLL